ncbi:expansin family protein [Russula brevipes]|nr:expansin family protein [Russula brevipes]
MYKLTLILFALISLVLPIIAAPVPEEAGELEKRATHAGRGTWYDAGLGNCGWTNKGSDLIVAISKGFYDQTGGSNCGKHVQINSGGKTVTAQIVDSCPGCGPNDLDMSRALFQHFAPLSVGVLHITWSIV